jgi:hypothetical protein
MPISLSRSLLYSSKSIAQSPGARSYKRNDGGSSPAIVGQAAARLRTSPLHTCRESCETLAPLRSGATKDRRETPFASGRRWLNPSSYCPVSGCRPTSCSIGRRCLSRQASSWSGRCGPHLIPPVIAQLVRELRIGGRGGKRDFLMTLVGGLSGRGSGVCHVSDRACAWPVGPQVDRLEGRGVFVTCRPHRWTSLSTDPATAASTASAGPLRGPWTLSQGEEFARRRLGAGLAGRVRQTPTQEPRGLFFLAPSRPIGHGARARRRMRIR